MHAFGGGYACVEWKCREAWIACVIRHVAGSFTTWRRQAQCPQLFTESVTQFRFSSFLFRVVVFLRFLFCFVFRPKSASIPPLSYRQGRKISAEQQKGISKVVDTFPIPPTRQTDATLWMSTPNLTTTMWVEENWLRFIHWFKRILHDLSDSPMKLEHNSKLNIVMHCLKDYVQTMKKERKKKMNKASTVLEKTHSRSGK